MQQTDEEKFKSGCISVLIVLGISFLLYKGCMSIVSPAEPKEQESTIPVPHNDVVTNAESVRGILEQIRDKDRAKGFESDPFLGAADILVLAGELLYCQKNGVDSIQPIIAMVRDSMMHYQAHILPILRKRYVAELSKKMGVSIRCGGINNEELYIAAAAGQNTEVFAKSIVDFKYKEQLNTLRYKKVLFPASMGWQDNYTCLLTSANDTAIIRTY